MKVTEEELLKRKLIPVHKNFRVIAIGLPVPPFIGNPLDPPLRSRFQSYSIENVTPSILLAEIRRNYAPSEKSQDSVILFLTFIKSLKFITLQKASQTGVENQLLAFHHLPQLGEIQLLTACKIFEIFHKILVIPILHRVFPYRFIVHNEQALEMIDKLLVPLIEEDQMNSHENYYFTKIAKALPLSHESLSHNYKFDNVLFKNSLIKTGRDLVIEFAQLNSKFQTQVAVRGGPNVHALHIHEPTSLGSKHHLLLSNLLQSHAIGRDICLIGNKGEGKTHLIAEFSRILGYSTRGDVESNVISVEPLFLYKDMSARDLLQRRSTTSTGETIWQSTPLISALLHGGIALLDGIHRLSLGCICILSRLIQDREITLFDGRRFIRWDRYMEKKELLKVSDEELANTYNLYPVHPCFRIIATALPPDRSNPWLHVDILHLFDFHNVDLFDYNQSNYLPGSVSNLLQSIVPGSKWEFLVQLEKLGKRMRELTEDPVIQLENPISLRQLIRIAKRSVIAPNECFETIENILMIRFMPQQKREVLVQLLEELQLSSNQTILRLLHIETDATASHASNEIIIDDEKEDGSYRLQIGSISIQVHPPANSELVPDVLFFNIPKHVKLLQSMLKDFISGEHLLLIGNQGVGKNKLTDRLLQLLQKEREYIQLHRDTTVQSLTITPSLQAGVIVWEDSPLVRSMVCGRILVIDEADKAPTEVVCILKALLEDGEILLSDGRRFVSEKSIFNKIKNYELERSKNIFPVHPEFRVIALGISHFLLLFIFLFLSLLFLTPFLSSLEFLFF